MSTRNFFIILAIVLAVFFNNLANQPKVTSFESAVINPKADPIQQTVYGDKSFVIKTSDGEYKVNPMAYYYITALVVSKTNYFLDRESELAPFDLALAWGDLTSPDYGKYVSYSQYGRWYYFRYNADSPYSEGYIYEHSSNHHIIPADDNIKKAINTLGKDQKVVLSGYLVAVDSLKDNWHWSSSLSRQDRGNGACELFYVNKVRIGDVIYK